MLVPARRYGVDLLQDRGREHFAICILLEPAGILHVASFAARGMQVHWFQLSLS